MNNKRKNRGGTQRPQRPRSVQPEGVYSNAHFMHAATSQVGNVVRIQTVSGNVWEGVLRTFSNQFDAVLEVAVKIDNPDSSTPTLLVDTLVDKLIFKSCDIISIVARDVDPEFATRDTFQTDTAISARLNGTQRIEEKELEPWDASSGINGGDNISLELEGGANGWDANDMFRKNEQIYGITSTYDHTLAGYTVQLQPNDTPDYREAEAKADLIANEIENQPTFKTRQDMENGDEEAMYASVVRPNQQDGGGGKYVPPAKRKNQNAGKLMRSTPPPAAATNPTAKGAPVAPSYNQQHNMIPHGRPHSHTPPHSYSAPPQPQQQPPPPPQQQPRQAPPPNLTLTNGPKANQMNGEAKQMNRGPPRNVYAPSQPQQQPPPPQPAAAAPPNYQEKEAINHVVRHREETVKDFHKFSQEFKLVEQKPQQQVPSTDQKQLPPPPQQQQRQPSPPQIQQSVSPQQQQQDVDKMTNTLKKSTLNPNAKEFVMNPSAKPFTPRAPSTPTVSRPHTPQTPSHNSYIPVTVGGGPVGQPPVPVAMMQMGGYIMPPNQSHFQPPPQGNRVRKSEYYPVKRHNHHPLDFSTAVPMRSDMASQMQVAAATGQPLLAPAPLPSFVYPPGINSQGYPQMHAVRMYDGPPPLQYLPQNPSNAPSPAQPPPYNPAQGPQHPPQQYHSTPPPQGHQYGLVCPIISTQPHMMQGMQYLQQPPPPQGPIQVLLPPPPQQPPQQHGQAP